MSMEKEIKKAISEGKAVLGKNEVRRGLKAGGLKSVLCASNCPLDWLKDLEYYAGLSKVELEKLADDSAKLGQVCGKPFNVTVIGIKK
jgi:large subunit ribosomal protein L30e